MYFFPCGTFGVGESLLNLGQEHPELISNYNVQQWIKCIVDLIQLGSQLSNTFVIKCYVDFFID